MRPSTWSTTDSSASAGSPSARLAELYPDAKPGAIPVWAGVLLRFVNEMRPGDLVIYPHKRDSTLNFGRIASRYYFGPNAPLHRKRRKVDWLMTGVPRAHFSKSALFEIGSAVTLFRVKKHKDEFLRAGPVNPDDPTGPVTDATTTAEAEEEPNAQRIETYTRDFVIETLMRGIEGIGFEHFVADVLRAMGYRATVTQASRDGGFDVIAHKDPLQLEPPIIKVQCKRTLNPIGAPDVQKLSGTLAPGNSEVGLFVTLGTYSADAKHVGRNRQDVRLISGTELVELVIENYDALSPESKRLIPLRRVHVVDRDTGIG